MNPNLRSVADVDRLIHEPARMMIMALLFVVEEVDFLYLLRETGLTKGNLSAHLAKLEQANYVCIQKVFRGKIPNTRISLTPSGREAFEAYRQKLKEIMTHLST